MEGCLHQFLSISRSCVQLRVNDGLQQQRGQPQDPPERRWVCLGALRNPAVAQPSGLQWRHQLGTQHLPAELQE